MFKKTMKFDDLDGNEVEQTFYFNYNKKEIAELLEFGRILRFPAREGVTYLPLEEQLERLSTPVSKSGLSQQENNIQAYQIFENLLLDAYGVKGDDNVSFNKTPELRHYWSTHVAFVDLIFEFIENPTLGAQFVENCLPAKMVAKAKDELTSKSGVSGGTLSEMVAEAERRQNDPATRIEPGTYPEGTDPGVRQLGEHIASEQQKQQRDVTTIHGGVDTVDETTSEKRPEDLTPQDILSMDDIAFKKLDEKRLTKESLLAAFRRKNSN